MSFPTFKKAIALANDFGEQISIGGGEPTIHPKFMEFLGYAIVYNRNYLVWLATNGKITAIANMLATLAERQIISCELSRDEFHEEIDPNIVRRFERLNLIRNATEHRPPIGAGRALESFGKDDLDRKSCICGDYFVRPNGSIHFCGCKDSPKLGTVNGVDDWRAEEHSEYDCYRNLRK
jgi:hypothetical protein